MGAHHNHAQTGTQTSRNRIGLAALITGIFVIVEVVGGLISGSLALLADAGHMLTDFGALAMAWWAFVLAQRPANTRLTFGYERVSVLVAFVNGLTLFGICLWIVLEAFRRFQSPGEVLAGPMLWVALGGLVVNIFVFMILRGADQDNLNVRGAVLHVLGDLLGSVAAIAAALIILKTGWMAADPVLSIFVALLILRSAYVLIKDSAHILLEGAPKDLNREEIERNLLASVEGLSQLKDIHIWSLTENRILLTLQGESEAGLAHDVAQSVKDYLVHHYHIHHSVVEISEP